MGVADIVLLSYYAESAEQKVQGLPGECTGLIPTVQFLQGWYLYLVTSAQCIDDLQGWYLCLVTSAQCINDLQGWYLYLVTSRWFGLRIDLISALYLGVVAFISIPLARSKLSLGPPPDSKNLDPPPPNPNKKTPQV